MSCGQGDSTAGEQLPLTGAHLAAGAEEVTPDLAPVHARHRIRKGRSHLCWLMDSPAGELVVKVPMRELSPAMAERLAEQQRAGDHGVPVTPVVAWTDSSLAVDGRSLTVLRYLPGTNAEELFPHLSSEYRLHAMRGAGDALARLHGLPVAGFGEPASGMGHGPFTWAEYVRARVDGLARQHRDADVVPAGLLEPAFRKLSERQAARVIKTVPDKAQFPVRVRALTEGKLVYMAVPKLAEPLPFYLLDPANLDVPPSEAAASRTASTVARKVGIDELSPVDLVICASVAVNRDGARLGKGAGYSDIEVALLHEAGLLSPHTMIVTTVHPLQVLDEPLPETEHDFSVDVIVTPEELTTCAPPRRPATFSGNTCERIRLKRSLY